LSSRNRRMRDLYVLGALLLTTSVGCWEQWSNAWFPQMKWQISVHPFRSTDHDGKVDLFLPPEGPVPVGAPGTPLMSKLDEAAQSAVPNPRPATLASLMNGREQFDIFCAPCHGATGAGDGPVSMMGPVQGPLAGVLPLTGAANIVRIRTDGHLYATIRYGRRRMPAYQRIDEDSRWDIVNYVRNLNGQQGVAAQ